MIYHILPLVTRTKKYEHITPILEDLHWLPVKHRIEYKIALITFNALNDIAPTYIADLISEYKPIRTLRSSSELLLRRPKSNTHFYGDRAFSVAAPRFWNSLPSEIRNLSTLGHFKRALKTHIFKCVY